MGKMDFNSTIVFIKMVLYTGGMILGYLLLPLILCGLLMAGIIVLIEAIRKRDVRKLIFGSVIILVVLAGTMQSDAVKSRKVVDEEWMIGKSLDQISWRYSNKKGEVLTRYDDLEIAGKKYVYCAREIYVWDILYGVCGENLYFALIDENGMAEDIYKISWVSGAISEPLGNYWERWGF